LCIADAGSRVSLTGGPYAYVGTAFGAYAGFMSGLMLWMLGTFAGAAVSTIFASSVGLLVPSLSGRVPETIVLLVVFAFWTWVNLRGVALASRLNSVATVAKLAPLLLVAIGGLFFIEPSNLTWTSTPAAADVARTSLLLIFAFAGIECALVPSGEVRDTARTVPRAIALAMVGITVLYLLLQVVAQGVLGDGLALATTSPLADTATASLGGWAGSILLAGASISMFGYIGGMTLSVPRMVYAFARDGFLPRMLAAVNPANQAPSSAIVVQSTVTLALALSGTFERLALLANVSALVLYLGCALASWKLRSDGVALEGQAPLRVPFAAVIPWLTCAVIVWLLTGLARAEWFAFGVCVAIGTLAYFTRGMKGAGTAGA